MPHALHSTLLVLRHLRQVGVESVPQFSHRHFQEFVPASPGDMSCSRGGGGSGAGAAAVTSTLRFFTGRAVMLIIVGDGASSPSAASRICQLDTLSDVSLMRRTYLHPEERRGSSSPM